MHTHIKPTTVECIHDSAEAAAPSSSEGFSEASEAAPEQHVLEHLLLETRSLALVDVKQKLNLRQPVRAVNLRGLDTKKYVCMYVCMYVCV